MSENAVRESATVIGHAYYDQACYEQLLELTQGRFHDGETYAEWREGSESEYEHLYRATNGGSYLVPLSSSEIKEYAAKCKQPISSSLVADLVAKKLEQSSSVEREFSMPLEIALQRLDEFDSVYKRSAVEAVLAQPGLAEELLLQRLGDLAANLQKYAHRENYMGHIYVSYLCAYWKMPRAHELLTKCFVMPDGDRHDIWGDFTTESLPMVLVRTFNGNSQAMRELIRNEAVDEFTRTSVLTAYAHLSRRGLVPAREVYQLCVDLLRAGFQL